MEKEEEKGDKENVPGTTLFPVGQETETFLKSCFSSRAENSTRRQWREKHGAPCTACPKLDKILKSSLSHQTKAKDKQLSKAQALLLDAVGPLAYLLEEASKGSLTQESALEASQMALKLLGNASGHMSTERRKNILANLNPRLTDMADEDGLYKDAAPNLFGEGFSKKAKERDDKLKVLRSARLQSDSKRQPNKDQFFRGSRPFGGPRRGGGPARGGQRHYGQRPRPYGSSRGRGGHQSSQQNTQG